MTTKSPEANNTDLAFKLVAFSVIAALSIFLIYQLKIFIVCIILALTLASAMAPLAEMNEKYKIPRICTVLFLYLLAICVYALLAALIVPSVQEQCCKLNENLPAYISRFWYHNPLHLADKAHAIGLGSDDLNDFSIKLLNHTLDMTAGFVGLVLNAILTLFLAAYFVVEADKIWASIFKWLPAKMEQTFAPLIVPLSKRMGGYVRGQLLVACGAGLFLFFGFKLLGIEYALLLGLLAATLNLVPYVGSLVAVICALVVAFNQDPILAGGVLILYMVEQWVESTFMVPLFLGANVSLHPLIVLLAILFGATLMGIPGALAAVPLIAAIMLLAEEFHLKRLLKTSMPTKE